MWTLESQILSALYNDSEALARGRLFVIFPLPRSTLSPKHLAGLVSYLAKRLNRQAHYVVTSSLGA